MGWAELQVASAQSDQTQHGVGGLVGWGGELPIAGGIWMHCDSLGLLRLFLLVSACVLPGD